MSSKPKVIKKWERVAMYTLFGLVDAAQAFLVETVFVGTIIDVCAAAVLLVYGLIRRLWTTNKLLTLLATFVGEAIPLINALPFWWMDVRNLYSGVVSEEELEKESTEMVMQSLVRNPLNEGGRREARGVANPQNPPPFTADGYGRPRGIPEKTGSTIGKVLASSEKALSA